MTAESLFGGGRRQRLTALRRRLLLACVLLLAAPAYGFETFNRIKATGELRVGQLAPAGATAEQDRALALGLAERLGVRPYFIDLVGVDALLQALEMGQVDVAIEPLSPARPLPSNLSFTLPVRHADLWLVSSPYMSDARSRAAPLTVHFASDAWHQALDLKKRNADLRVAVARASDSRLALLTQVARGERAASLAYTHELVDQNIPDLRARQQLRDHVALSWVLRDKDRVLRKKVNDFLRERSLTQTALYVDHGDWPSIAERDRLRVVTLYRPETYFAWAGQFLGFEYDLARAFAQSNKVDLEIVIARDREDMIQRLAAGEADLAAAFLTSEDLGEAATASEPYFQARGRLVSPRGRFYRLSAVDFQRKRVLINERSPYAEYFQQLVDSGVSVTILSSPLAGADLVEAMMGGQADLAVIDAHEYQLLSVWRNDIVSLMTLEAPSPRVWAVRPDAPQLLSRVNQFLASKASQRRRQVGTSKYFAGLRVHRTVREAIERFQRDHGLSPFDDLIRRYASYYAFDWRLILAVVLQESRFDPKAVSRSGARGLMQVQDAAARQVGITRLFEPKAAIHAGVRYLDWARNQFEAELDIRDRTWFSLAAYNGGLTHVNAARDLARRQGRDPRRWFGHVELAMADLAKQPRYRALDAQQVINYVERIRGYFEMYVRLTEHEQPIPARSATPVVAASPSTPRPAVGPSPR
ncbi:MAG: transporter substrate-binding domain-containing protein [Pseudomonadota bacterium]